LEQKKGEKKEKKRKRKKRTRTTTTRMMPKVANWCAAAAALSSTNISQCVKLLAT
jgi:hypothetical protein